MTDEQREPIEGEQPAKPQIRPFAAVLQEIRSGVAHSELSAKLAEVVEAVATHGKPGSVTLQINVRPSEGLDAIVLSDKITVKVPEADKPASLFFTDDHGNLTRNNPRQQELQPLREVTAAREMREVTPREEAR